MVWAEMDYFLVQNRPALNSVPTELNPRMKFKFAFLKKF